MNSALSIIALVALALVGVSCGSSGSSSDQASPQAGLPTQSSSPAGGSPAQSASASGSTPSMGDSPAQAPAPVSLAGVWSGNGVDSNANTGANGVTMVTWTLAQPDATSISGTVTTQSVEPLNTTCISCHRNKTGTLSGTIAGTTVTLTMAFPAGNPFRNPNDVTPICSAVLTGTVSGMTQGSLTASYSGSDLCEGPIMDGTLTMTRQP